MASIYKRGKTWAYKVYYYDNGKQKAVSKSGFKTKAEAKDASVKRENEMLQGKNFAKEKIYLADYMRTWKKIYKEGKVSIGVLNRIDRVIRYVEKNYNLMLKDITPDNYQEYINKLAERLSFPFILTYSQGFFTKTSVLTACLIAPATYSLYFITDSVDNRSASLLIYSW